MFPSRVRVKVVINLTPETAVPIKELSDQLSIFENVSSPVAWTGNLRGSPRQWKVSDAEVVEKAIYEAKRNPVTRPIARNKLDRQPIVLRTKIGSVTLPGLDGSIEKPVLSSVEISPAPVEPRLHTEIQWLLLKLGNDMGLDVEWPI